MAPGGGGYSRRGELRRKQIMDTAEEVFATERFNATSLRTLAKKVGVTHAGILRHYSSKEDLLLALRSRACPGVRPAPRQASTRPRRLSARPGRSSSCTVERFTTRHTRTA
ncbi:TetR/AcrR family transcriptional regulator [Amycolatopsis taiwanensis]|uniref:TetR/AcrR family transcriptional regulator n=1 Tax=Amycolatopsis taiwanensis TaxID=342230 RepID=UPI00255481A9|nr:helix-turn-helix domain-containing protein [Amycolatopsis taiwanensis]